MAANSNIPEIAFQKTEQIAWGVDNCEDVSKHILINYINNLSCEGIDVPNCIPDKCPPLDYDEFDCSLVINNITGSSSVVSGADYSFKVDQSSISGYKEPLAYQWEFNTGDWDLVGLDNASQIYLKLKAGKSLSTLLTYIRVTITDDNNCKGEKECWYTPDGMNCTGLFEPCFVPRNLIIT